MIEALFQPVVVGALLTGFVGYVATNLDNIAVLCAVVAGLSDAARKAAGALVAAAVVLGILAVIGAEIADEMPLELLRWLGLVPVSLGLFSLFRLVREGVEEQNSTDAIAGFFPLTLIVLSNSADTLAVFVPLLAESTTPVRASFLGGAGCAALIFALMLRSVLSNEALQSWLGRLGVWFAPVAMIAAGLYVILDTPTDLL